MTGVEVQPADFVEAAVNACKRACLAMAHKSRARASRRLVDPAEWDLSYAEILDVAQQIADGRVRDIPG